MSSLSQEWGLDDREALRDLFDYTTSTWEAYGRAVRTLPDHALARPVEGSGWPTLNVVPLHIAVGWDDWLRDRLRLADPLDAALDTLTEWSDLDVHRQRTRGWLRRVIDETTDDDLHTRAQPMFEGTPAEMRVSVAEILPHILLHERGHHGDITTLLAHLGATPPSIRLSDIRVLQATANDAALIHVPCAWPAKR